MSTTAYSVLIDNEIGLCQSGWLWFGDPNARRVLPEHGWGKPETGPANVEHKK